MITTDELKVQLADYGTAVKDLEEALAIDASRKRVQELEHTMSRPGFYDDAELSKKVFDEVGDLKGKLSRFEKLQGLYDDAETMLVMLDEEYDPEMVPEAEEAVNAVGKAVDELQLMTMLNGDVRPQQRDPDLPRPVPAAPRRRTGPRCSTVCTTSGHRHTA